MLTVSDDDDDLFEAVKSGANGYLLKKLNLDDLFSYLEKVYEGEPQFSEGLANKILEEFSLISRLQENKAETVYELTKREKEILELAAQGYLNKEIADHLCISPHTVKKHLQNILAKLHVNNRTEAVAMAIEEGIIDPRLKDRS